MTALLMLVRETLVFGGRRVHQQLMALAAGVQNTSQGLSH
jgi:hypothetical protein